MEKNQNHWNPLGSRTLTNVLLLGIVFLLIIIASLQAVQIIGKEAVGNWALAGLEHLQNSLEAWKSALTQDDAQPQGGFRSEEPFGRVQYYGWTFQEGEDPIPVEIPEVVLEEIEMFPYNPDETVITEDLEKVEFFHHYNFFRAPVNAEGGYSINKDEDQEGFWVDDIRHTFTYNQQLVRHVDWTINIWGQSEVITLTHGSQAEGRIYWENNTIDIPYGNPIKVSSCSDSMWFYITPDGLIHFLTKMSYPEMETVHFKMCGGISVSITAYNVAIPFGVADAYALSYEHRWNIPLGCIHPDGAPGPCLLTWPE